MRPKAAPDDCKSCQSLSSFGVGSVCLGVVCGCMNSECIVLVDPLVIHDVGGGLPLQNGYKQLHLRALYIPSNRDVSTLP